MKAVRRQKRLKNCIKNSSLIRKGPARDINDYNKALGHPSETITCATAHASGVLLKEKFQPCKDCALGKAKIVAQDLCK